MSAAIDVIKQRDKAAIYVAWEASIYRIDQEDRIVGGPSTRRALSLQPAPDISPSLHRKETESLNRYVSSRATIHIHRHVVH